MKIKLIGGPKHLKTIEIEDDLTIFKVYSYNVPPLINAISTFQTHYYYKTGIVYKNAVCFTYSELQESKLLRRWEYEKPNVETR